MHVCVHTCFKKRDRSSGLGHSSRTRLWQSSGRAGWGPTGGARHVCVLLTPAVGTVPDGGASATCGFLLPQEASRRPVPTWAGTRPSHRDPFGTSCPGNFTQPRGGATQALGVSRSPLALCLLVLHPHVIMAPAHSDTLPLSRAVSPSVSPHDSSQVAPPPSPGLNPGLGRLRACTGDRPPLHGSFSAVSLQRGHSQTPQVRRQPPLTASLWGHPCPPGPGSHSGLSKAQLSSVCPACGFQQRGLAARSPREAGRGSHSARQTLLKGTTITVE